jgi:hypothetical protein
MTVNLKITHGNKTKQMHIKYKNILYFKHCYASYMFRPLFCLSSERFITKDEYIEILRKFVNLCTEVKY